MARKSQEEVWEQRIQLVFSNSYFIEWMLQDHVWPESWIDRSQGYSGGVSPRWETNQPPEARREESQATCPHIYTQSERKVQELNCVGNQGKPQGTPDIQGESRVKQRYDNPLPKSRA